MQYRIITNNPNWPAILMGSDGNYLCCDSVEEAQELLESLRTDSCKEERHHEIEHEPYDDDYIPPPEREYLRHSVEDY